MTIVVRAELAVPAAKRAEFVEVAQALAAAAADEPGTLRYDWYESTDHPADTALFVVIEEYADPEAAVAHNQHRPELLDRAGQLAEMTSAQLHGDLGPELEAWAAERPLASTHRPLRR